MKKDKLNYQNNKSRKEILYYDTPLNVTYPVINSLIRLLGSITDNTSVNLKKKGNYRSYNELIYINSKTTTPHGNSIFEI